MLPCFAGALLWSGQQGLFVVMAMTMAMKDRREQTRRDATRRGVNPSNSDSPIVELSLKVVVGWLNPHYDVGGSYIVRATAYLSARGAMRAMSVSGP